MSGRQMSTSRRDSKRDSKKDKALFHVADVLPPGRMPRSVIFRRLIATLCGAKLLSMVFFPCAIIAKFVPFRWSQIKDWRLQELDVKNRTPDAPDFDVHAADLFCLY